LGWHNSFDGWIGESKLEIETLGLFILVLGLSVRHGFKIGSAATLGIISTNAVYFTLSALGVGALIVASSTLFTVIKWIGAAYLAYLGVNMLRPLVRRLRGQVDHDKQVIDVAEASRKVRSMEYNTWKAFTQGFMLQACCKLQIQRTFCFSLPFFHNLYRLKEMSPASL